MLRLLLLSLLLALTLPVAAEPTIIRTPVTGEEKGKIDAFVAGRKLLEITDFSSPELDSIAPIEILIFRKAVLLGGVDAIFDDLVVPNSARGREVIRNGAALGGGTAQWHVYYENARDDLFESDALIAQGGYEKGLYTTRDKAQQLKVARLDDLRRLIAVSSDIWVVDWRTLARLPLKALYSAPNRPTQFRMVSGGRADFTLQDFSAMPDLSIEEGGVRLYPVAGVKIALNGTRHFFVSRKHADGARIFAALQKGLRLMRQSGEIERLLARSLGHGEATRNWRLLNAVRSD